MGNWITSTLLRFDPFLFFTHQNSLQFHREQAPHVNSPYLVRVAAEIVELQRRRMNDEDEDTDFSSDDDCPEMSAAEEARMFERERQVAFSGRFTIGDHKSLSNLREDISMRCECVPSTSITNYCLSRETGTQRGGCVMTKRAQTTVSNAFAPNRRKNVFKAQTKTFCCQYAQQGNILVTASQDERIRFFRRAHKKHPTHYEQFNVLRADVCSWSILDVAIAEDAQTLCYSTWQQAIYLARLGANEAKSEEEQRVAWNHIDLEVPQGHNMAVFSLRYSKDSRQIVCGSSDYSLHVFDVERKCRLRTIGQAHDDDVNAVCFADDTSNMIYSAGDDGLIKVWDRRAWSEGDLEPIGVFAGHRDGITYVDSRCDDRYLLSNCKDQTIKVWDMRKFSGSEGIAETRQCVNQQKWDYRWQPAPPGLCQPVRGDTSVMTLRGHNVLHTLVRAKFSPEHTGKRYIYTGCARGEVVVYDMLTGVVSNRLKGHIGVVRDVDWHPQFNEMVSASWDGVTSIWYWDERANHVTAPFDDAKFGDEDSCDESYNPIFRQNLATSSTKRSRKYRM